MEALSSSSISMTRAMPRRPTAPRTDSTVTSCSAPPVLHVAVLKTELRDVWDDDDEDE